jgi:hypothetical protein
MEEIMSEPTKNNQVVSHVSQPNCAPDASFESVVSYPERTEDWGDGGYHGNCDGRLFLNLLHLYQPRDVADPMCGSGTTRDVVRDYNASTGRNVLYWGSDLRDGFDASVGEFPGEFDLVWVHPPYWDIVRYGAGVGDLSAVFEYAEFVARLGLCLERASRALRPGGRLAVLVADIRRKGRYYALGRDVMALEERLGAIRSIIIKVQHRCRSDWKSYRLEDPRIRHEYCIVFKRPA